MPDYAEELLSGNIQTKKPKKRDWADEILNVGGTFQPKKSPVPGGSPPVSTITGKPEKEYIPQDEPGAKFTTMAKAGFVDDPVTKIKIYAEDRGISIAEIPKRYRINKGKIEFKTDSGKWQREVSEVPLSRVVQGVAQTASHPSTILGTAGAIVGNAPLAVVASMVGETIRKGVGKFVYDEPQTMWGNLIDITLEGALALGGEMIGKVISGSINKYLGRKAKALKYAGREIRQGVLSPQDHAKAVYIKSLADQHNITLAPHQLYDKEGMTNIWKYLRKHPLTANAVQGFEKNLENQADEAIDGFIRKMGGYEKTPDVLGKKLKDLSGKTIQLVEDARMSAASPHYDAAFNRVPFEQVDISDAMTEVDRLIGETVKGDPSHTALKRIKNMLTNSHGNLRRLDRVKRSGIDNVLNKTATSRTLSRELKLVKDKLTKAMDEQVPEYAKAREAYSKLSKPIDRLKESIIGTLSELKGDEAISQAHQKLFKTGKKISPVFFRQAREIIVKQDPELWRESIGAYIRDVYQDLVVTEEGKVINAVGKLNKRLFGSKRQQNLMAEAFGGKNNPEFNTFKSLMEVFQRAAIGVSRESMTAPFQQIGKELGDIPGSKIYRAAMFPKQQAVEMAFGWWNDALVRGRQKELLEALTAPNVQSKLAQLKQLSPKGRKFWEAFSVMAALVGKKIEPRELPDTDLEQKQSREQPEPGQRLRSQ